MIVWWYYTDVWQFFLLTIKHNAGLHLLIQGLADSDEFLLHTIPPHLLMYMHVWPQRAHALLIKSYRFGLLKKFTVCKGGGGGQKFYWKSKYLSNSWNISSMGVQIFQNIWTGSPNISKYLDRGIQFGGVQFFCDTTAFVFDPVGRLVWCNCYVHPKFKLMKRMAQVHTELSMK